MQCLRGYFACKFLNSGYVSATWLLKHVALQISANEKNVFETIHFLVRHGLAIDSRKHGSVGELGRDFSELKWKAKSMTVKRWQKRQRDIGTLLLQQQCQMEHLHLQCLNQSLVLDALGRNSCNTAVATIMTRVFSKAVRSPKCRPGKRRFSNPKHLSITHQVRLCAVL